MYKIRYYIAQLRNLKNYYFGAQKIEGDLDNAIIFMLACDYNNIGDVLIRESQEGFLEKHAKGRRIITIDYGKTFHYLRYIINKATKNTIITLTGGGDVDDRYTGIERARNQIIKRLSKKNCRVISFPQTIDYSSTAKGNFYRKKAQDAYRKNSNLFFIAREKKSYYKANNIFNNTNILLMPDIVFTHGTMIGTKKRTGIGLFLRKDGEKIVDDLVLERLISKLKNDKNAIAKNDMTVPVFNYAKMHDYVKEKVSFAQTKKLIITDRLHGMILCYITNTPCVAFVNSNHKISETYKNWLENKQNFIILETNDNVDKIIDDVNKLLNLKKIQKEEMTNNFMELIRLIEA